MHAFWRSLDSININSDPTFTFAVYSRNHSDDNDSLWRWWPWHGQRCTSLQHHQTVTRQTVPQHVLHRRRKRGHCHCHFSRVTRQRGGLANVFPCTALNCAVLSHLSLSMMCVSAKQDIVFFRFCLSLASLKLSLRLHFSRVITGAVRKVKRVRMLYGSYEWLSVYLYEKVKKPDECPSISPSHPRETTRWLLLQRGDEFQNIDWIRWWKRNISCCQTLSE